MTWSWQRVEVACSTCGVPFTRTIAGNAPWRGRGYHTDTHPTECLSCRIGPSVQSQINQEDEMREHLNGRPE